MASSTTPPRRPSNLLTIFQAHFHTRRGNELTFQAGHDLDLAGVEWKVLPSGSHALSHDLIWFTLSDAAEGQAHGYEKIGVACFRNRQLTSDSIENEEDEEDEAGNADLVSHTASVSQHQPSTRLDQRGARMTAVGVIIASPSSLPSHQLAAFVPHLEPLSHLADLSSRQPRNHTILKAFLEAHRFSTTSSDSCLPLLHLRAPSPLTRWPSSVCDPLLELPSIVNALGLILPEVLRALLLSGTRMLIFSPQGVETRSAASIAWVFAEMVEAALSSTEADCNEGADDENGPAVQPSRSVHVPQIRGIIGLHELSHLQDEEARRKHAGSMSGVTPIRGWISWTTDKLYLEKVDLYDCLLDLTPLAKGVSSSSSGAGQAHSVLSAYDGSNRTSGSAPLFYRVDRPDASPASDFSHSKTKGQRAKLQKQTWRAQDFTTYRDNEMRCVTDINRPRRQSRRGVDDTVVSHSAQSTTDDIHTGSTLQHERFARNSSWRARGTLTRQSSGTPTKQHQMTRIFSVLLDLLRYYLYTQAFISRPWRPRLHERIRLGGESYGYVPLSIRPDGGVQAGLMLLPDDSDSDSDSEADESDGDAQYDANNVSDQVENRFKRSESCSSQANSSQTGSGQGSAETRSSHGTRKTATAAVAVAAASSSSLSTPNAARQRERNPFSDMENDDDDEDKDSGDSSDPGYRTTRKRSLSSSRSGGGGDVDPILAACGASPNGLSPGRRTSRSSFSGSNTSAHSLSRRRSNSNRGDGGTGGGKVVAGRLSGTDRSGSASLSASGRTVPSGSGPGSTSKTDKLVLPSTDRRVSARTENTFSQGTATPSPDKETFGADRPPQTPKPSPQPASSGLSTTVAENREGKDATTSLGPRETYLARAIFASWGQWLTELVQALEMLRTIRSSTQNMRDIMTTTTTTIKQPHEPLHRSLSESSLRNDPNDPSRPLMRVRDQDATVAVAAVAEDLPPLSSRDLSNSSTALNARYTSDRILVQQWTGREVRVESVWKFWAW